MSVLKKARQAEKSLPKHMQGDEIMVNNLNDTAILADGSVVPNVIIDDNYPNWESVIPTYDEPVSLGINASLLKSLSEALGTEELCLTFQPNEKGEINRAILVRPLRDDNNQRGIIMPMRVKE